MISKRAFLTGAAALGGVAMTSPVWAGPAEAPLTSMVAGIKPIAPEEYKARIAKLQGLMQAARIGAFIVECGSSLRYFTGIQWGRSERVTAAVIPANGDPVVVTPVFEEPSVRETLMIPAEVRAWNEDESPEARMAGVLSDRKITSGKVAVEPTVRFFVVDALRKLATGCDIVSGEALINGCRQIKSPTELALMQVANDITLAALRHVHGHVQPGMTQHDIASLMDATSSALGGPPEFSLVLLNEASAYPHGSHQAQQVREGSTILMDCGAQVFGYQSDMSRSWVYGEPSAKQRKVWNTVKRGQEIALETAKIGVPVGTIDDAVRAFYTREGWGPGYHLPGLSHRTGHGIGLDGHESAYLVHGDTTPLAAGMCFSDEPGLYIPGEFGIRLEDCWHMTEQGPKLFSPLATSIDQPV
jgi:Xaa-Pro dipeptidase